MTKEEILAMEAGKELDKLVMTQIFGYEEWVEGLTWRNPETLGVISMNISPSTDIAAAWQVVEKMLGEGRIWYAYSVERFNACQFAKAPFPNKRIAVDISVNVLADNIIEGNFGMPEAICKAALLAKVEG